MRTPDLPRLRADPGLQQFARTMTWLGPAVASIIGLAVLVAAIWAATMVVPELGPFAIAALIGLSTVELLLIAGAVFSIRGHLRRRNTSLTEADATSTQADRSAR